MPRFEVSTDINASPTHVFDACLAADQIAGYPAWNPTFARGLRIVSQTDGVGTTWEFDLVATGAVGQAQIVGYEPPSLLRAEMTGGIFVELVSEFRLSPIEGGTRLTRMIEYRLCYQPVSTFVDIAFLRGRVKADARAGLQAMKQRAESSAALAA
jgi:uncharacterized protein YndB with AHSA1/START domain